MYGEEGTKGGESEAQRKEGEGYIQVRDPEDRAASDRRRLPNMSSKLLVTEGQDETYRPGRHSDRRQRTAAHLESQCVSASMFGPRASCTPPV